MHKLFSIIICAITILLVTSFNIHFLQDGKIKKELIGTWEFVELLDNNGNKIDTIRYVNGWEIPKGPTIIFNSDGSYLKQFTPVDADKGKWTYSAKNNTITYNLSLNIKLPTDKFLIERGLAKKDDQGNYYEEIYDSIVSLSDRTLKIFEQPGKIRIFIKVK